MSDSTRVAFHSLLNRYGSANPAVEPVETPEGASLGYLFPIWGLVAELLLRFNFIKAQFAFAQF